MGSLMGGKIERTVGIAGGTVECGITELEAFDTTVTADPDPAPESV